MRALNASQVRRASGLRTLPQLIAVILSVVNCAIAVQESKSSSGNFQRHLRSPFWPTLLEQRTNNRIANFVASEITSELSNSNSHAKPKVIPLSALDKYNEGSELKLFCSASSASKLSFEWRKNSFELLANRLVMSGADSESELSDKSRSQSEPDSRQRLKISIQTIDDSSTSVLRIANLSARDSGNYTCIARNSHGSDSSSVRIDVNGRYLSSAVKLVRSCQFLNSRPLGSVVRELANTQSVICAA